MRRSIVSRVLLAEERSGGVRIAPCCSTIGGSHPCNAKDAGARSAIGKIAALVSIRVAGNGHASIASETLPAASGVQLGAFLTPAPALKGRRSHPVRRDRWSRGAH